MGQGYVAKWQETAGHLPCPSVTDVPELSSGTWDLLVWTWGRSSSWDACPKPHPRARLIVGDVTEPFSPQLVAGADFTPAKLNCPGQQAAIMKEKLPKRIKTD